MNLYPGITHQIKELSNEISLQRVDVNENMHWKIMRTTKKPRKQQPHSWIRIGQDIKQNKKWRFSTTSWNNNLPQQTTENFKRKQKKKRWKNKEPIRKRDEYYDNNNRRNKRKNQD